MVFQRAETRHPLVLLRPQPRNYLANLNQEEEEEGPAGEGGREMCVGGIKVSLQYICCAQHLWTF